MNLGDALAEALAKGRQEGMEKGMEQGMEKGIEKTIKAFMDSQGYTRQQVLELLGWDKGSVKGRGISPLNLQQSSVTREALVSVNLGDALAEAFEKGREEGIA